MPDRTCRVSIRYAKHNHKPEALSLHALNCYIRQVWASSPDGPQLLNHCLYGLLLALLSPVWVVRSPVAGGGPGGGVYSGDGSPGAGWLLVAPAPSCDGSTLVAPAGGWYEGGAGAFGS
jgi:hypothetical protein